MSRILTEPCVLKDVDVATQCAYPECICWVVKLVSNQVCRIGIGLPRDVAAHCRTSQTGSDSAVHNTGSAESSGTIELLTSHRRLVAQRRLEAYLRS